MNRMVFKISQLGNLWQKAIRPVLMVVLMVYFGSPVGAQSLTDSLANRPISQRNLVKYIKRHVVCQQGEEMNVVDVDLEWPLYLGGNTVDSLQLRLQQLAFSCTAADWQQAMGQFIAGYGTPVKGQLAVIPDDNKFCYVNVAVRELGLWQNQFASFLVSVSVDPHKDNSHKSLSSQNIVTFDLLKHEFLKRDQLLRIARITDVPSYSLQFSKLLLDNTHPALGFVPSGISLGNQVAIGTQRLIVPYVAFDDNMASEAYDAYIPLSQLSDFLTKNFQKRLSLDETRVGDGAMKSISLGDGADVCSNPTTYPKLMLSKPTTLSTYLLSQVVLPEGIEEENPGSKVLASFIVKEDGTIGDVDILRSASPSVDRAVVTAIKLMPRLKPAMKDGKKVKVRMFVPFVFHYQGAQ